MKGFCLVALLGSIAPVFAGEVLVPMVVHTNQSSLELTLTIQGAADTDTRPLAGDILLAVDCFAPLAAASLRDFHLRATTNFNAHLDYGFLGDIFGTLTNLEASHAAPGPEQPYQPLTGENVTFPDVPALLGGVARYEATGLVCATLQGSGIPCNGVIDFGQPPRRDTIDRVQGTLTVSNGVLRFVGGFRFSTTLVPESPGVGQISGVAQVNASGVLQSCLRIKPALSPGEHLVSWPSAFVGFRLFRATSLTPTVHWEAVDESFVRDDGTNKTALLVAEGARAFYRLSNE
jgi:hypothetical protein